jgi:hypothetical protein
MKRLIIAAAMAAATITSAHAEYTEHQKAVLMDTAITGGIYKRFCPGYEALPQHKMAIRHVPRIDRQRWRKRGSVQGRFQETIGRSY